MMISRFPTVPLLASEVGPEHRSGSHAHLYAVCSLRVLETLAGVAVGPLEAFADRWASATETCHPRIGSSLDIAAEVVAEMKAGLTSESLANTSAGKAGTRDARRLCRGPATLQKRVRTVTALMLPDGRAGGQDCGSCAATSERALMDRFLRVGAQATFPYDTKLDPAMIPSGGCGTGVVPGEAGTVWEMAVMIAAWNAQREVREARRLVYSALCRTPANAIMAQ